MFKNLILEAHPEKYWEKCQLSFYQSGDYNFIKTDGIKILQRNYGKYTVIDNIISLNSESDNRYYQISFKNYPEKNDFGFYKSEKVYQFLANNSLEEMGFSKEKYYQIEKS